jgi:ABC-type Zn uptake system ZnuABC Zn-binding protein ZnuA
VLHRLSILVFLSALMFGQGRAVAQDKPVIVASFSIINDWVQAVGGKEFETFSIIPPRSEAHGFQLSPRHLKDLRRATLVVGLSPDFEPWLAAWGKANQRADSILWLHAETSAHEGHDCAAIPHAWTDPVEVRKMVKRLAARLTAVSGGRLPHNSYEQYVAEVDAVERELAELFRAVAPEKRAFVSHHANLDLFARRFGLTVAGTIVASGSGESADPSARHFSGLLEIIRKRPVRVIVADAGQNQAFARRLTEDAGLPPPLALSFEYLELPGQPGDTWASMMRLNGRRLQQALLGP